MVIKKKHFFPLNDNNTVCACKCSLSHTHTQTQFYSLLRPWIFKSASFEHRRKLEELRRGVGKGLRIAPDVRIYQQAGGIRQSVWKGFLKCTHTISITLTSNNLQKFCIHLKKKGKHERDSSFRAQSVWQRYKRKKIKYNTWLHTLCWRCRKLGSGSLFV